MRDLDFNGMPILHGLVKSIDNRDWIEGLNLRHLKRNRRHLNALRKALTTMPQRANECWTMDFVSDALFDGRRLRALTVLDTFTRESLAIEVGKNLWGEDVVAALSRIAF